MSKDNRVSDELSPCPHCGPGESVVEAWQDDFGYWRVTCGRCGSSSGTIPGKPTEENLKRWPEPRSLAIAGWNKRSKPTAGAEAKGDVLFTTIQDAYLRGMDWGRKYGSTEAEEIKASYDYADKTTAALSALSLPEQEPAHPDDSAVDRFAAAMKEKLAKKRAEGRGGWDRKDECTAEFLSQLLREHVQKGDPVDVGNLAMMLHQRAERISPQPEAVITDPQEIIPLLEEARDVALDLREFDNRFVSGVELALLSLNAARSALQEKQNG